MEKTTATSLRLEVSKLQQLDAIANVMERSRNWVLNAAVDNFLNYQDWFNQSVQEAIDDVKKGNFAKEEEIDSVFKKYGIDK